LFDKIGGKLGFSIGPFSIDFGKTSFERNKFDSKELISGGSMFFEGPGLFGIICNKVPEFPRA
jgi:hypothetical protein